MNKILLITPYTPDNQGAGVSYTSQLLSELSKNYIIDLVYFRYEDDTPFQPYNSNIRIIREKVISTKDKIKALIYKPLIFPLFSARFDKETCEFIKDIANADNYKLVYLDFSQTFLYAKYINHPQIIMMSHDVIAQKYSRMKQYLRPWAMHTEQRLLKKGTITFTFSQKDSNLLKQYYGIKSLNTTFFLNKNVQQAFPNAESDYFIFFGSWSRRENSEGLEWFLHSVIKSISKSIKFKIIGGGLPDSLKKLIDEFDNIEYLGFVENPYPVIANARAEIAPLFKGAGVKVKCIEALACGTPVIGTNIAFEGIDEEYHNFFSEAKTPDDYINAISNLNLSLSEKLKIKRVFMVSYNNKAILDYIKNFNK